MLWLMLHTLLVLHHTLGNMAFTYRLLCFQMDSLLMVEAELHPTLLITLLLLATFTDTDPKLIS